ncbi:MAG: Ldh family oxidoreductase [Lachnospiraceae bacterium]
MSSVLEYGKIKALIEEIFEKAGLSETYAKIVADNLLEAEIRGVRSHGLIQVQNYVRELEEGKIQKEGTPQILREYPGTLLIDGKHLPGAVIGNYAFDKTMEKAKATGVAVTAVKGCTHFGMAAYYAMKALKETMIGLAFCSAGTLVAPYGGYRRELGTNPICVAVPAGMERPVVFDAATSYRAFNKIFFAKEENRKIPFGWALDQEGNPTEEPEEAMQGALLPFGEYKGYGLSIIVNVITGILGGAAIEKDENGRIGENTQEIGYHFAAIDISKFQDTEEFKQTMDVFIKRLKSSGTKGGEEILIPGEPEFLQREESLQNGIVIYDGVWESLRHLVKQLNTRIVLEECGKA